MTVRQYVKSVKAMVTETCSGSWTTRRDPDYYEASSVGRNAWKKVGRAWCHVCGEAVALTKRNRAAGFWLIVQHSRFSPDQPDPVWDSS